MTLRPNVTEIVRSGLVVVVGVAWAVFNGAIVIEYFGSGPPYYERSVNMDKWSNPTPLMIVVDLACLAVVALGIVLLRSARRQR